MGAGPVNRALLTSFYQNAGDTYDDNKTEGAIGVLADQADANYDYFAGMVAGGVLQPYPAFLSRQALINGNFDVWQRGTTSTNPATFSYFSDHWRINVSSGGGVLPNIVHSRQGLTSGELQGSYYFYRKNVDGAGTALGAGSGSFLSQPVEYGTRFLCGLSKKITISFWAKSSIAGKRIGVFAYQTYGSGGSPTVAEPLTGTTVNLSSNWTKYAVVLTTNALVGKIFGSNNDDYLQPVLMDMWGSAYSAALGGASVETFVGAGNIDIAQVQVNAGDTALPFQPRSFADELSLCQRYYEKSYDYGTVAGTASATNGRVQWDSSGGAFTGTGISFKTRKRVVPTINVYSTNTGAVNKIYNATTGADLAGGADAPGESGFKLFVANAASTAANLLHAHYAADAEL